LTIPVKGTIGRTTTPTTPGSSTPDESTPSSNEAAAASPEATGTFSIQRFARTTEDAVAAVGTLTLSFEEGDGGARTIVTQIAMPLERAGDTTTPGDEGESPVGNGTRPERTGAQAAEPCQTVSFVLGPVSFQVVGLSVQLEEVNLDLTTVQGVSEQVGTLLCNVSGSAQGAARSNEVITTLNKLLDLIG
jgi:hypothetical protein